MLTNGVTGGLLLAFMRAINPGDEIVVPDPYFVMYKLGADAGRDVRVCR